MWAPTALSFRLLPATITINNNNRSITVSAKHPRHQNHKNIIYDFSDEEDEDQQQEPETYVSNDQQQQQPETYVSSSTNSNNDEDVNKISGSAVLLALQRASEAKTSKKAKKKKVVVKKVNDENVNVDYGDVKELCIKSDWKERLDELELKLHHLVHHNT